MVELLQIATDSKRGILKRGARREASSGEEAGGKLKVRRGRSRRVRFPPHARLGFLHSHMSLRRFELSSELSRVPVGRHIARTENGTGESVFQRRSRWARGPQRGWRLAALKQGTPKATCATRSRSLALLVNTRWCPAREERPSKRFKPASPHAHDPSGRPLLFM